MKIVTADEIKQIHELYDKLKDYVMVARRVGISPSTIKKYLGIEDKENTSIIRFEKPLPEFDTTKFRNTDWGDLCTLTEEEIEEVKQLWTELEV